MVDLAHGTGKSDAPLQNPPSATSSATGTHGARAQAGVQSGAQSGENVLGFPVTRTTSPRPRPSTTKLGFGKFLTDHVFVAEHDGKSWQNARIVPASQPHVSLAAGAVQYGLSIFEGLKAFRTGSDIKLFRPQAHAKRFAASAKRLCMPEVPVELFLEAVRAIVRVDADWCPTHDVGALYVRPTLHADESFLGVRPANEHVFSVMLSPVGSYWDGDEHALRLWAEKEFVRAAKGGVGAVKTGGNYATSLLGAKRAKERGFDQVLWLDAVHHENLEEAGTMNVFVRIGDRVITPPLEGTILAGITRDSCLTLLRDWGVPVEERTVSLTEIADASRAGKPVELWGTGTAAVISPIREVAWEGGAITSTNFEVAPRLKKALDGIHAGKDPDPHGWLLSI